MRNLESLGWAKFAAYSAILPLSPIAWPLGILFGIWSLAVLHRQAVASAFADESVRAVHKRAVTSSEPVGTIPMIASGMIGPLTMLMVLSVVTLALAITTAGNSLGLFAGPFSACPHANMPDAVRYYHGYNFLGVLCHLPLELLMVAGCWKGWHRGDDRWATLASVLAFVPTTPLVLLTAPIGAWATPSGVGISRPSA